MTQNAPSTTNKDHLDSRAKFVRDRYRLVAQFGKTICDISMTLHVCVFKHGMAVVEREVCQRHVRCTGNGEHVVEHKLKGRVSLVDLIIGSTLACDVTAKVRSASEGR